MSGVSLCLQPSTALPKTHTWFILLSSQKAQCRPYVCTIRQQESKADPAGSPSSQQIVHLCPANLGDTPASSRSCWMLLTVIPNICSCLCTD